MTGRCTPDRWGRSISGEDRGEEGAGAEAAKRAAYLREPAGPPPPLQAHGVLVELNTCLAPYLRRWAFLGGTGVALANPSGKSKVAPVAAAADGWALARTIPGGPVAWIALSVTVDTNRRELKLLRCSGAARTGCSRTSQPGAPSTRSTPCWPQAAMAALM